MINRTNWNVLILSSTCNLAPGLVNQALSIFMDWFKTIVNTTAVICTECKEQGGAKKEMNAIDLCF